MKKIKYAIIQLTLIFLLSSCFFDGINAEPEIIFKTYFSNDLYESSYTNSIIIDKDTLEIKNLRYLISDLKLTKNNKTIFVSDYNLIDEYEYIILDDSYSGIYQISFNFGIKNIDFEYDKLNSNGFEIDEGYYFMKMELNKKSNDSTYNYNIAKLNKLSKINSFNVSIDGFDLGGVFFINKAIIGINLNNLFTKPNLNTSLLCRCFTI